MSADSEKVGGWSGNLAYPPSLKELASLPKIATRVQLESIVGRSPIKTIPPRLAHHTS